LAIYIFNQQYYNILIRGFQESNSWPSDHSQGGFEHMDCIQRTYPLLKYKVQNIFRFGGVLVDVEFDGARVEVGAVGETALSNDLDVALVGQGCIVSAGIGSGADDVVPAGQAVNGIVGQDCPVVVDTWGGDLRADGSIALDVDAIAIISREADVSARDGEVSYSAGHGFTVCGKLLLVIVRIERFGWDSILHTLKVTRVG
jgi:hypothetical protein